MGNHYDTDPQLELIAVVADASKAESAQFEKDISFTDFHVCSLITGKSKSMTRT